MEQGQLWPSGKLGIRNPECCGEWARKGAPQDSHPEGAQGGPSGRALTHPLLGEAAGSHGHSDGSVTLYRLRHVTAGATTACGISRYPVDSSLTEARDPGLKEGKKTR